MYHIIVETFSIFIAAIAETKIVEEQKSTSIVAPE